MNEAQIQWAMSHDWAITPTSQGVIVRGDTGEAKEITFTNARALRVWAGY
jgi:hypothetical protein